MKNPQTSQGSRSAAPLPAMDWSNVTVVCCIEAGTLEVQTVRMVDSLRRWGGRMAGVPITAVISRPGPPLSTETRRRLADLGVVPVRAPRGAGRYAWFNFANKVVAASYADQQTAPTDQLLWLDSDMIILREPTDLLLRDGEDFLARREMFPPAVTHDNSPYLPYWLAVTKVFDIDFQSLPWLETHMPVTPRVKLFWNSGAFAWRPHCGLPEAWLKHMNALLDARIASHTMGFHLTEQVALGLAVQHLGFQYRPLRIHHNHPINQFILDDGTHLDTFHEACILHYHESTQPKYFTRLLSHIRKHRPDVADWLEPQGPLADPTHGIHRIAARALRSIRHARYKLFERGARHY